MFLKNKNIIFKIRRLKVTDYAALSYKIQVIGLSLTLSTSQVLLLYYKLFEDNKTIEAKP